MSNNWIVIPARGGSVGIPRKNLWLLNGKPMVQHALTAALEVTANTVLITDDDEIAEVGELVGAKIIIEPEHATGKKTLDEVIFGYLNQLRQLGAESDDYLITLQPTSPLIEPASLLAAFEVLHNSASVLSVSDDRHLRWRKSETGYEPEYEKRLNRQQLAASFRETGAIIGCKISDFEKSKTRINQPVELIELDQRQAIDIDDFSDLAVAEHFFSQKTIYFRTDSSEQLGMGHVYRVLAMAQQLARHKLKIILSPERPLGQNFFEQFGFDYQALDDSEFANLIETDKPDLLVFDYLDSDYQLVHKLKTLSPETKILSFEDQGFGAQLADLVISDLYPNESIAENKQLSGLQYSILAPSFETLPRISEFQPEVRHIVVLFGGTDPSGLAEKTLSALEQTKFAGQVIVIRGMGAKPISADWKLDVQILKNVKNMPRVLAQADLAFSSAGRTITELASLGVPTICMAQNQKELKHSHTTEQNGVVMLGLGSEVSEPNLVKTIESLLIDPVRRRALSENALSSVANRSNQKIVDEIMNRLFS